MARRILAQAGVDDFDAGLGFVARALLGPEGLEYGRRDQAADGELAADPWRIVLRPGLSDAETNAATASGLATWWLLLHGDATSRAWVEDVAIDLLLPGDVFWASARECDADIVALSLEFTCPLHVVRAKLSRRGSSQRPSVRLRVAS